jgi:uncharacterized membrane protein
MTAARERHRRSIGNVVAPPRFLVFAVVVAASAALLLPRLGFHMGTMIAFDIGAIVFLAICIPLLRHEADAMRRTACRNDANRLVLLAVTGGVTVVILIAIASELMQRAAPQPAMLALVVSTLALSWTFSNTVYTLHYAHLFYRADPQGNDTGGLDFPKTPDPNYWDFIYFAFCLGMTFQTSDVTVTTRQLRRVVTLHCLAAFVFNLGVVAFTINVLGGS